MDPVVIHNAARSRFELNLDGHRCELNYRLDGNTLRIHHTGVAPALEGRGLASRLVQAAVDHARAQQLKIIPMCSYVSAWLRRHPEHADLID